MELAEQALAEVNSIRATEAVGLISDDAVVFVDVRD
ncbi:MAG: rhodanese-like domain-containing protein, partial [Acidimicrobiaceae bacterium]|nr:rhodanese-like domain-containing protein [Acidimicrobiaceae bacterium]